MTGATLRKVISQNVDIGGSTLYTDESKNYTVLGREFAAHKTVNHSEDEYVATSPTTLLPATPPKTSSANSSGPRWHAPPRQPRAPRYLAEFDFRYSSRKISDTARMNKLMGQVGGKRLTYKRVTAQH